MRETPETPFQERTKLSKVTEEHRCTEVREVQWKRHRQEDEKKIFRYIVV